MEDEGSTRLLYTYTPSNERHNYKLLPIRIVIDPFRIDAQE